ncbi:RNA-directed DNA polymerase [Methylobacterium sp.]|uniref:RNA-directed DNA polymerase n=1 Tax=Methylobacterium sp. TaxID=409 RepID=UPI00272C3412|nr:RNA-directed DNA polymerase [Methylobacterium sp.]
MEKSKGLCRQIVIPSLQDAIVLQRLSDALYAEIRGKAPSKKAFFEPEDHGFSNQKKDEHGLPRYGSLKSWLKFQKTLLKFAAERNFVVVTDIANYYDFISYSHLRNIISSQIDVKEAILDTLIFILSGLLWQPDYMPRAEIGLPQIDLDASRILAHCFLYELDEHLEAQSDIDFVRYMDDIDIGVDTFVAAKRILRDIDLILHTRQVRLNSGKTKILTGIQAQDHFRVRDNNFLDLVTRRIDRKIKSGSSLNLERKLFERFFTSKYKTNSFDAGNGDKILKRSLTLARRLNAGIDKNVIYNILANNPSSRESVLRFISSKKLRPRNINSLTKFLLGGEIVDEVATILTAECITDCLSSKSQEINKAINLINQSLKMKNGKIEIYSMLWINSKYSSAKTILELLKDTFDIWRPDPSLGRLVGGLAPVLKIEGLENEFLKILTNAKNRDATEVWQFHNDVSRDSKSLMAVKSIIAAPNPSRPLGITHPKFLVLLSIFANPNFSPKQKSLLINSHSQARKDPYYRHKMALSLPRSLRDSVYI